MTTASAQIDSRAVADARVVDGALIASFMGAEPPKVWRADMRNLSTATFELREGEGLFRVVMKTGEAQEDIAGFKTREEAAAALQSLMGAMLSPAVATAGGQPGMTPAAPAAAKKPSGLWGVVKKVFKVAFWTAGILIVIGMVIMLMVPKMISQIMVGGSATVPGVVIEEGAPVSADELFGGE